MTSVTVAGGSFDVPRQVTKKARKDTAKRDRWVRYGAGLSIAGILAADSFVLNGMLRHAAGDVAEILVDPPSSAAATAASETAAPAQGFAGLNVPADRPLGASGRTFSKWTNPSRLSSVAAAEAPAYLPSVPELAAPVLGPATGEAQNSQNPGGGGGDGGDGGNGGGGSSPIPAPATVFQQLADVVGTVPVVGEQLAPVIVQVGEQADEVAPPAPAPNPVEQVVDPVVAAVVEPVAASTESVPVVGDVLP
jgi:hypothetical protein